MVEWAWLVQLVESLPSDHKVPSSIPALPRLEYLCDLSFSTLNEFLYLLEANLGEVVFCPGKVKDSHLLNKTESGDVSACSMGL